MSHLEFAARLHGLIAGGSEENIAWSPYSVAAGLYLAAAGAGGRTRQEILATAGRLPEPGAWPEGVEIANTLWVDSVLPVEASYEAAAWRAADFRGDPEGSRRFINADVEKATGGWIKDLLGPRIVTAETLAVLVNALWVRLAWLEPFPLEDTRPRPFRAPAGMGEVPVMAWTGHLEYANADGWQLATCRSRARDDGSSWPCAGDLVLDVLLPRGELGTPDAATLERLYGTARRELVDLWLPRFAAAHGTELADELAGLGVRTLFTDEADLSGISRQPLKIAKVIHRAVLTVDEQGAEGAAATALVAAPGGPPPMEPPRPVEMHVDRPFLALVRHVPSGAILFMAQVTRP